MSSLPEPRRFSPMPSVKYRRATIACSSCGGPVHPEDARCTWCTSVPTGELAGYATLSGAALRLQVTAGILTPREARAQFGLKQFPDLASGDGD